jgi:hypothetical protein
MSQKKIVSKKFVTFGNMNDESDVNIGSSKGISSKRESIFEKYSNIANINSELHEKTRNE